LAGSKERDRRRARERFERQQQLQLERRRKLRKRWGIGTTVFLAVCLVAGLSTALVVHLNDTHAAAAAAASKSASAAASSASASASAAASASAVAAASASAIASEEAVNASEPATHCDYITKGVATAAKKVSLPPADPNYKATYTATINTNLGPIVIDLLNSKATCTVNSFVHLATAGYFNASQCHRVTSTGGLYVLQCGDPLATATTKLTCSDASNAPGTGGPGYEFDSENLQTTGISSSGTVTYKAGTVAMANSGASDTNGSQFFLVYQNSTLQPDYTPFGTITSGLDILQKVAKAGTSCDYTSGESGDGAPKDKVIINSVTIKQS
jgi:peptidyl-prolyl cis-trans isomerase B (cyclophilin B)